MSSSKHQYSSRYMRGESSRRRQPSTSSQSSSGYTGGTRGSGADQKQRQMPPGGCGYCNNGKIRTTKWERREFRCDGECRGSSSWRGQEIAVACYRCSPKPRPGQVRRRPNPNCPDCDGWGQTTEFAKCRDCDGTTRVYRTIQVPTVVDCPECKAESSYAF